MNEDKAKDQLPILRFMKKHKWRLIVPVLFIMFYISLPQILSDWTAVQQNLFIKSEKLNQRDLANEANSTIKYIQSDEFMENMILKYDLFLSEKDEKKTQIEKLRKAIDIHLEEEMLVEGVSVKVWTHFKEKKNAQYIVEISNDVASEFEQNQSLHIDKYVTKPYDAVGNRRYFQFVYNIFQSLILLSLPLILLWEIPNMFYSQKTKRMVFNPLKSDWQNELFEAKLRKKTWKVVQINIRYSYAFLAAMIQKSPLGDLAEFVRKFAK